jgi:hypothetical protein
MALTTTTTRRAHGLLVWGLVAIVVGMPLASLVANFSPATFVSTESEKSSDGESDGIDCEFLKLFTLPGNHRLPERPAYADHGADYLAESCSALSDPHFERGPPRS